MTTIKTLILTAVVALAWGAEFKVKNQTTTCILLSVSGTVDLKGMNGTASLGEKKLTFDDATVLDSSDCTTIKLNMTDSTQVWFQSSTTGGSQSVVPVSTFNPNTLFAVNDTAPVFQGTALGTFSTDQSFSCVASVDHSLSTSTQTTYNYTAVVTTSKLQVQFGNIANDSFSDGPHCSEDATTTPQPTTTPTPASTTAAPEPPVNDFNVTNGNVTCIRLMGAFKMDIDYVAKTGNKTYSSVIPKSATATGDCSTGNTSSITITFDLGLGGAPWQLQYTFVSSDKTEYHISGIELTYSNLPDAASAASQVWSYQPQGDYLKATTSGYYLCNADQAISNQSVTLTSMDFKYRAFNTDTKGLDFNGDVVECSADDETSSVVPIAVGAALAGLVVIVLVAYLIGRRRSRKSGYESV